MARKDRKIRRHKGEPQAPPTTADAELASLGLAQIEDRLAEHGRWVRRLAQDDPGAGLPPAQAKDARDARIASVEEQVVEVERLATALEMRSTEATKTLRLDPLFHRKRSREIGTRHPEQSEFIRQLHENLAARERERQAERELRDLAEARKNPPDPRSTELLAAVAADASLFEALEVRLREDGSGGYTATHNLTPLELGVLVACLHLLRERGHVEITGMGSNAAWPRREPPLVLVEGLRDALLQLRAQGYLAFRVESGTACVTYGERVREIAERWGIALTEPEASQVAASA